MPDFDLLANPVDYWVDPFFPPRDFFLLTKGALSVIRKSAGTVLGWSHFSQKYNHSLEAIAFNVFSGGAISIVKWVENNIFIVGTSTV